MSLLAWLLSYLLHSTLLLVAAWIVTRLSSLTLASQELVWRCALLGGVLTASLPALTGHEPLAGSLHLQASPPHASAPFTNGEASMEPVSATLAAPAPMSKATMSRAFVSPASLHAEVASRATEAGLCIADSLAVLWLLGAVLLLLSLSIGHGRLLWRLRDRKPVGGALESLFEKLSLCINHRPPGRLTRSRRLRIPIAFGILHPEVCIPSRVADELHPAQTRGIIAHELSHLERRDPFWLLLYRIVEAVFFFQPLNRLARQKLTALAEMDCDDRAIGLTGDPVALARSLTEVAALSLEPAATAALGSKTSHVEQRVERLLLDSKRKLAMQQDNAKNRWLTFALSSATLSLMALMAPVVLALAPPSDDEAPSSAHAPVLPAPPSLEAPLTTIESPPVAVSKPAPVTAPEGVESLPAPPAPVSQAAPVASPAPAEQPAPVASAAPQRPTEPGSRELSEVERRLRAEVAALREQMASQIESLRHELSEARGAREARQETAKHLMAEAEARQAQARELREMELRRARQEADTARSQLESAARLASERVPDQTRELRASIAELEQKLAASQRAREEERRFFEEQLAAAKRQATPRQDPSAQDR